MEEIQDVLSKRNQERRQKLIGMDIVAVAYSLGMTLKEGSSGSYYWDEHDSFHIYPKTNTFRWWSRGVGTNTIDLVQVVKEELTGQKPSFLEVASFLETGKFDHVSIQPIIKEPFKYYLERFEQPSFDVARQYLREERGLSDETIDTFLASKNMALITYKTGGQIEPVIVFKSRDETGKMIGANLQGIVENRDKYPKYGRLKQVMKNSDGLAGFSFDIGQPKRLIFTEAAIDLMSYYELHKDDLQDVRLVSLGGVKKSIVSRYVADMLSDGKYSQMRSAEQTKGALDVINQTTNLLQERPNLITLAVDNDKAGRDFIAQFHEANIPIVIDLPPLNNDSSKMDWNDYLKLLKKKGYKNMNQNNLEEFQTPFFNAETLDRYVEDVAQYYTDDIETAEYLFPDGRLVSSMEEGVRGDDHRAIRSYFDAMDAQELDIFDEHPDDFWNFVHNGIGAVRLVPETSMALIAQNQQLTPEQEAVLEDSGFELEACHEGRVITPDYLESLGIRSNLLSQADAAQSQVAISDIQEQLSFEGDLEGSVESDDQVIYTNTVRFDQNHDLVLTVYSPDEVENLSDVNAAWTLEVLKEGQFEGFLAYGEDWGNDFSIEEELTHLEQWIANNQVTERLYPKEEVEEFLKAFTSENDNKKTPESLQEILSSRLEQQEKTLSQSQESNTGGERFNRNSSFLGEDSPRTAPKPVGDETQPDFPTNVHFNFSIDRSKKSTVGLRNGYEYVDNKQLRQLNLFADDMKKSANWYLDNISDSQITYFYQDGNDVSSLRVQFEKKNWMHLTGVAPVYSNWVDTLSESFIDDVAKGHGEFANLSMGRGAMEKLQVLPMLPEILETDSFVFDDLSSVQKFQRLDAQQAIRTDNEQLILAFKMEGDALHPATLLKPSKKLNITLDKLNQEKTILGVIIEKDSQVKVHRVNDKYVKDGGAEMKAIVEKKQFEELDHVKANTPDFKWVVEFNETSSEAISIPNLKGQELTKDLLETLKQYDDRIHLSAFKGYFKVYFDKVQDGKVVPNAGERLDIGDGVEANRLVYERLEEGLRQEQVVNTPEGKVTARDFTKVLDSVYHLGAQIGKDNRANIPKEFHPAWDKYYEYEKAYDGDFDRIVKAARYDDLLDESSDFYKTDWLRKIQEANQKQKDSDGDGLTDEEEVALGTNPYSPDTDGDGVSDGVERGSGTDATNPSDNPANKQEEMQKRDLALSKMIKARDTAALNAHLQEGIKDYFDSQTYQNYLEGMSHFNNYSARNIRLIQAQLQGATMVASSTEWKKRNGHVKAGEKALYIQAPVNVIKKGEDGKPIINKETGKKEMITYFKPVSVFDVSQIQAFEGKELQLPKASEAIPEQLTKEYYQNVYRALRDVSQRENGVPIRFRDVDYDGLYDLKTNEIIIKKGMSYEKTLATLIHEIAHSELHNKKSLTERFDNQLTLSSEELQAESIAYVVANHLGFDTREETFAYLASWSQEKDGLQNLTAQLEIVQEEAGSLMKRIDKHLEKYQAVTVSDKKELTQHQRREMEKAKNPFYQSLQKAKEGTTTNQKNVGNDKDDDLKKGNRPTMP